MNIDFRAFAFIITLAAVVNGLGIVRWLTALAEYLRQKDSLSIQHYWVYNLAAGFQFLLHIVLWWSLWALREGVTINFLSYLYLLVGPVLLYLGTSLLVPNIDDGGVDVRAHYYRSRRTYSTVLMVTWLWAILLSPVMRGFFGPAAQMAMLFLAIAATRRITANPKIHAAMAVLNWMLLAAFVALHAMELG